MLRFFQTIYTSVIQATVNIVLDSFNVTIRIQDKIINSPEALFRYLSFYQYLLVLKKLRGLGKRSVIKIN